MTQERLVEIQPPAALPRTGFAAWMALLAAFLGWMFDGLEMGIFPLAARPAIRDLLHTVDEGEVSRWFAILTSVFLIGAAAGGLLFGWLGDRIGRVRAMSASILAYSLFTGACYFADSPFTLAALRFLASLGMGGEWSLGVALVMECWPAHARPLLAGAIGAASNLGFLLIAVIALYFKVTESSWRWIMLAGAAPALLTFFIRIFVPESPRWRAVAEAGPSRPLEVIFGPRLRRTTLLAIAFGSIALVGTWGLVQWIPNWVESDELTAGYDRDAKATAKAAAQICSALGAIVGCFVGAWLGGRIGRRPVYFLLCLGSIVVCEITFLGASGYNANLLFKIFLVGGMTAAFYGWLPLYLPELFPTAVRATGQGLAFNFGRIVAAGCALMTGYLVTLFGNRVGDAAAFTSLVYVLGLGLIWLAPETKGKPLPE